MSEFKDLTGRKFGYLTVLGLNQNGHKRKSWVCECICGKKLVLPECRIIDKPRRKPNKSCGCMKNSQNGYTQTQPKLYGTWYKNISKCYDETDTTYFKYGAKGTTVCNEWRESFISFMEWSLANGYSEELTLDRIDNSKGYSPDNCRWVNYYVQAANKGIKSTNTTGYTGVCSHGKNSWRAAISRDGVKRHLGSYLDINDAIKARQDAEEYFEKHGVLPEYHNR